MDGEETTRVETLIPYREASFAPRRSLGRADPRSESPAAVCAKLGRYLASGLGEGGEADAALMAAGWLAPGEGWEPAGEPEGGSLLARILAATGARPGARTLLRAPDGRGAAHFLLVAHDAGLKERYWGYGLAWCMRSCPGDKVRLGAVRLDHALGAMELLDGPGEAWDVLRAAKHGHRQLRGADMRLFVERAEARWDEEGCREENRRHAASEGRHVAGVFEDKRQCDRAHRAAAEEGYFARAFSRVELDDEVDLGLYRSLEDEFERRAAAGEMPPADYGSLELRFRKTGRHRATGLYSHALRAVAVDPRAPRSMLHELAHAYDFERGMLSCSEGFRPILRAFRERFDASAVPASRAAYYTTPTEVFARAWEAHASLLGAGGSFVKAPETYRGHPAYAPLLAMADELGAYFSALAPAPAPRQAPTARAGAAAGEMPPAGPREAPAPPRPPLPEVPEGAQMPLFYLGEAWLEAPGGERSDLFASARAAGPPPLAQAAAAALEAAGARGGGRALR